MMDWFKKKISRSVVKKLRLARSRRRGEMLLDERIKCCDGKSNPIKFFSAEEILKATEKCFCKCNVFERSQNVCECSRVSELFFQQGRWYSGMLDNNRMILVKKLLGRSLDSREICGATRDIAISSMASGHKNFMKLVGCCFEFEYPVMVYCGREKQFSPINLEMVVSWRVRMKIAEEIATALAYLHNAFPRPLVYMNMGFGNVLVDHGDGIAKLSDFSYCVLIPEREKFVKLYSVDGDFDYMDDDCIFNRVVSEKTDMFGFGIFMQKLLMGEEIFDEFCGWKNWRGQNKFPKLLSNYMEKGRMNEIVDPKMLEEMGEISEEKRCRMKDFLVLSERCIGLRGEVPKMVEVAKELRRYLNQCNVNNQKC